MMRRQIGRESMMMFEDECELYKYRCQWVCCCITVDLRLTMLLCLWLTQDVGLTRPKTRMRRAAKQIDCIDVKRAQGR